MDLAALLRPIVALAGPAAVLAFGTFVTGMLVVGEDALDGSWYAIACSALLLVAVFAIGAAGFAALARLRESGARPAGAGLAVLGTGLVAGGTWASLFVMTTLAREAPDALRADLAGVTVGFIASYALFTAGWVWTGIALLRARLVPTWLGVLVAVAGVLAFVPSPEPFRLLVVGVVASLLAPRLAGPAAVRDRYSTSNSLNVAPPDRVA